MTIDIQKSQIIDRALGGQLFHQVIRGRVSELLLINPMTWHHKDLLTVKIRHEGGTETLVDRVSCLRLAELCDLKNGLPTTGSPDYPGESEGTNNDRNGYVQFNQGVRIWVTAFTVPLGHITLTGSQVLEITIDVASMERQPDPNNPGQTFDQPRGRVELLTVTKKTRADTLFQYEVTRDMESNQPNVRELYLCGRNNVSLFTNSPLGQSAGVYGLAVPMDISVKISGDNGDTEAGLNAYSSYTYIYGSITAPYGNLIRVHQDFESLPATVYVKVYGDDAEKGEIMVVREKTIPHMATASIVSALNIEQKRIEAVEQNDPAKAKALQQLGQIAKSEDLAKAKDEFVSAVPTPTK